MAGADLSYANFRNANCRYADFETAHLDGTNLDNADTEAEGASFDNHDLSEILNKKA